MADEKTKVNPAQTTDNGGKDATKPTDPNPEISAGANNPAQPQGTQQGTGAGQQNTGGDLNGGTSREATLAAQNGQPPAAATVGQTVTPMTPGRLPSESAGYSAIPAENTGDADSDGVGITQAVQRLQKPEHGHDMTNALGRVTNIPSGSRPLMIDTASGLGVQPPQTEEQNSDDGEHS